jgi:type VI secretion system protein ImpK
MSLLTEHQPTGSTLDLDLMLQDSYLLVIELKHGASVHDDAGLWTFCTQQVEHVRQALKDAGSSERCIDLISHAHCALLDETVLNCAPQGARDMWARESLQACFFSRHEAGESLYEEMRDVLREPAADPDVLRVYHRVLMFGFRGRYADLEHPERQKLLATLTSRVGPLSGRQWLPTIIDARSRRRWPNVFGSPWLHVIVAGCLLFAMWWGLDAFLASRVASLVIERV